MKGHHPTPSFDGLMDDGLMNDGLIIGEANASDRAYHLPERSAYTSSGSL